jgi:uncharacterized protein
MSYHTAVKIVDFILDNAPDGRWLDFCFFGGEPLLCFDLLKKLTYYIRKKEEEIERPIWINITTNGSLLTEPVLDFLREQDIYLCISIDGPRHIHNQNRRYKNGRGSFDDVVENLSRALDVLDYIKVNIVYGPETIVSLLESVSFLSDLGVPVIDLNPDISADWGEEACSKIQETYTRIGDLYIQSYLSGRELAVNLIDSMIILFLKGGYGPGDRCGRGETEWGFAPSGNIYPCERLIGEDNGSRFCLGNIQTGLDLERRCSLLEHRGNINEECRTCSLQRYCMNTCGCTNYHMTGHTNLTGPMMCESEKAAIITARRVFSTLSRDDLFIDHFMKYFSEGRYHK